MLVNHFWFSDSCKNIVASASAKSDCPSASARTSARANHVGCDHGIQIVAEHTLHFAVVDDFPDKPGCLRKNAANLRRELFVTFEQNTLKKEANLGGFGE